MTAVRAPLTIGEEMLREAGLPGPGAMSLQGVYNPCKLSMILFPERGTRVVAKFATGDEAKARLAREARALDMLHGVPEFRPLARLAPKGILHRETSRLGLHVQEYLRGTNLYEAFLLSPPKGPGAIARAIHPVLKLLHTPVPAGDSIVREDCPAQWCAALEEFLPFIAPGGNGAEGLRERILSVLEAFKAGIPAFWQHGDFFAKNIIVDAGRLRLVDWEDFGADWPPLFDLYEFAFTLYPWRQCPEYEEKRLDFFRRLLRGTSSLSRLFRRTESLLWQHWNLPLEHTREDYLLLALSLQAQRIRERLGPSSVEHGILAAMGRRVGEAILHGEGSQPGTTPPERPA